MKINLCLLIFGLLTGACNQKAGFSGGTAAGDAQAAERSTEAPLASPPEPQVEMVDIPQNIAGSTLYCAERKRATVEDLERQVGCRLNEAGTDKKIELQDPSSLLWGGAVNDNVTIDVSQKNPAWHAIYSIRGSSVEAIGETSNELSISVRWQEGKLAAPLHNESLPSVLQAITTSGDADAPIYSQGLDKTDPGYLDPEPG